MENKATICEKLIPREEKIFFIFLSIEKAGNLLISGGSLKIGYYKREATCVTIVKT